MLSKQDLLKVVTIDKGIEPMGNNRSKTPWGLKLGLLGLALSASPIALNGTIAGDKPIEKPLPASSKKPPQGEPTPITYPLDKVAASRTPEGIGTVDSIDSALAAAYRNNTVIKEFQAQVRSKDEGVPQALAGWRPTIYANASVGGEKNIISGDLNEDGDNGLTARQSGKNISSVSGDVTLEQNLFNGGKTIAETSQSESLVQAARAHLADKEREVFLETVKVYFMVLAKTAELKYRQSNEVALKETLKATQDKFNVGEETRTAIAQAEADLARGTADKKTVESELLSAKATFEQMTGAHPGPLTKPSDISGLPQTLTEAIEIAKKNNPAILAALYQEKADRNAIKAKEAELLPKVDLHGSFGRQNVNTRYPFLSTAGGSSKTNDFTTSQKVSVNLRVPLYEGGAIRGKGRELRETAEQRRIEIETTRRKIVQQLIEAWETYLSAKANVQQYKIQVKANEVGLEGTRQELLVGSKIVLDVLNARRELVNAQLNLVRAEQSYYQSAYGVLAAMGRLNALSMNLKVKRYDPTVHYQDVRNSW